MTYVELEHIRHALGLKEDLAEDDIRKIYIAIANIKTGNAKRIDTELNIGSLKAYQMGKIIRLDLEAK